MNYFTWENFYLSKAGNIVNHDGDNIFPNIEQTFDSIDAAEEYLKANDERGNVVCLFEDRPPKFNANYKRGAGK